MEKHARTAVRLSYVIDADPDFVCRHIAKPLHEQLCGDAPRRTVNVTILDRHVLLEYPDPLDQVVYLDLRSGLRRHFDHGRQVHRIDDVGVALARLRDAPATSNVRRTGIRRPIDVAGRVLNAERVDLVRNGTGIEIWAARLGVPESIEQAIWMALLPGLTNASSRTGAPVEVFVRDPTDPIASAVAVRLVGIERVEPPELPPVIPKGYRDESAKATRVPTRERSGHGRKGRERAAEEPRDAGELLQHAKRRFRRFESLLARTRHRLRSEGQDFAFAVRQALLDSARDAVNAFAAVFGSFYGHGEDGARAMHVELNWWQQLRDRLALPDEEVTLDTIRLMLLDFEVMQGAELPTDEDDPRGLAPDEQLLYQEALSDIDEEQRQKVGVAVARVLNFRDRFDVDRRIELAGVLFDRVTAVRDLDFETERLVRRGIVELVDFEAWDFDTEIFIDGEPIIGALEFRNGRMRLELTPKKIAVDFQFVTMPANTAASAICIIATAGLCVWIAQLNYGYGAFAIDNPRIALDILPVLESNEVQYRVVLDREDSSMDTSLFLIGVNPIADLIDLIVSAVVSMFDLLSGQIFQQIGQAVEELTLDNEALRWPLIWHATAAPPGRGTAAVFAPAGSALEGELVVTSGLPPGVAQDLDPALANEAAYVFSRRYLTAWLHEYSGVVFERRELPAGAVLEHFDVTLPAAESLDPDRADGRLLPDRIDVGGLPGIEGCGPTTTTSVHYANRVRLLRLRPFIRFPDANAATEVDDAGKVEVVYELVLRAEKTTSTSIPVADPGGCRRLDEPFPGQPRPGPDPSPIDPRAAAIRVLAARGRVPEGETPGSFLLGLERTERLASLYQRERGGRPHVPSSPREGSEANMPDPLSGDANRPLGPERPPRGDEPLGPGRGFEPELPTEICELPHCERMSAQLIESLGVYLSARVRVTGQLFVGFNGNGAIWLPEVSLIVAGKVDDEERVPTLAADVLSLDVASPFDVVDPQDLEAFVVQMCLDDARNLLGPAVSESRVEATRSLVPDAAKLLYAGDMNELRNVNFADFDAVWTTLSELLVFRQQGGETDTFRYIVHDELLYWPLAVEQHLTDHLT